MSCSSYQGYCYDTFGKKLFILSYDDVLTIGTHKFDIDKKICKRCGIKFCYDKCGNVVFVNSKKTIEYLSCEDYSIVDVLEG